MIYKNTSFEYFLGTSIDQWQTNNHVYTHLVIQSSPSNKTGLSSIKKGGHFLVFYYLTSVHLNSGLIRGNLCWEGLCKRGMTVYMYIHIMINVCYFVLCLMTIQILDFKSIKSLTLCIFQDGPSMSKTY